MEYYIVFMEQPILEQNNANNANTNIKITSEKEKQMYDILVKMAKQYSMQKNNTQKLQQGGQEKSLPFQQPKSSEQQLIQQTQQQLPNQVQQKVQQPIQQRVSQVPDQGDPQQGILQPSIQRNLGNNEALNMEKFNVLHKQQAQIDQQIEKLQQQSHHINNEMAQLKVDQTIDGVGNDLADNIIVIFGYTFNKTYFYIAIGIIVLIVVGYFAWSWYNGDSKKKQEYDDSDDDSDDEYEEEEDDDEEVTASKGKK